MSDPRERQGKGGRQDASGAPQASPAPPEPACIRAETPAQADELRELREVVALLRGLPEPEPPEDLVQRVMERVAEIESRPRYAAWRRDVAPVAGAALAAAVAGLLFFAALAPRQPVPFEAFGPRRTIYVQGVDPTAPTAGGAALRPRRPTAAYRPPAVVAGFAGPHTVSLADAMPGFGGPAAEVVRGAPADPIERGLDRQLNLMLLDPQAFFRRLEHVLERDRYLDRLARRAALRGDATQMALSLRSTRHDLARNASDQFLRASQVDYGPERRRD